VIDYFSTEKERLCGLNKRKLTIFRKRKRGKGRKKRKGAN
jgi:hypothetical protein